MDEWDTMVDCDFRYFPCFDFTAIEGSKLEDERSESRNMPAAAADANFGRQIAGGIIPTRRHHVDP